MTAVRRITGGFFKVAAAASLALGLAAPVGAQDSDAPVDVTAAPPPSPETVGPSQLRNFSLDGTVTRPADRPANTAPAPAQPNQPRAVAPTVTETPAATASTATAARRPSATSPIASPVASGGDVAGSAVGITPTLPTDGATSTAPASSFGSSAVPESPLAPDQEGLPWAWIAALIAVLGGGLFLLWSRRGRRARYGDPGRLAFAGLTAGDAPETTGFPPARPRHDPVPGRPSPVPPRAQNAPPQAAPASAPVAKPADNGLIVSTRLKPQPSVHFQPDRAVVTEQDVVLQFDVVVSNDGSAPARDVLVEARLVPAHAGQDRDIASFFAEPVGKGDRIPAIQPLGKLSLKSAVRLPLSEVRSFQVEGRTLFVPLVAFNILYGGGQASASFLVGRGGEGDEKLAPFRLDLGPRIFRGLSARPHSAGLAQQNAA
jgi:hypothetical protein